MKKLILYLAHNLNDRHEVRNVELAIESILNVDLRNPFYDRDRTHIKKIDNKECDRFDFTLSECYNIVKHDKEMIDESEGIVAVISENECHVGTILEIAYAYHCHKMIYIISNKFYNHAWLRVYATDRFRNWKSFIRFLTMEGYGR